MQKMTQNKQYDHEYKVQAIKLAREIGSAKAAAELGVPKNTMYGLILSIIVGTFSSNIHTLMRSYLRSHSTAAS